MGYWQNVAKDANGNPTEIKFQKSGHDKPATVVKPGGRFMLDDDIEFAIIGPLVNPNQVVRVNPDTGKPFDGSDVETTDTTPTTTPDGSKDQTDGDTSTTTATGDQAAQNADPSGASNVSAVGSVADQLNAAKNAAGKSGK